MLMPFTDAWALDMGTGSLAVLLEAQPANQTETAMPKSHRRRHMDVGSMTISSAAREPPAVAVRAERHVELAAHVGDEVGGEEIVAKARHANAVGIDDRDRAHGFAVAVCVPGKEDPLAAVLAHLDARGGRENAVHEARLDAA